MPHIAPVPNDDECRAKVYDLALARARRAIPATVQDEIDAAARISDALRAQGHELRFEQDHRRVRAELRSVDGAVIRRVPLTEAVDFFGGPFGPEAA